MNKQEQERVRLAVSCHDTDYIPKVAEAGKIFTNSLGERIQVMHNGVQVLADRYYSEILTQIIAGLKGHHEPQEEKVFYEILKMVEPGTAMMELGAYWSYYSLWFQSAIKGAKNIMVEPDAENLRVGRRNFELNEMKGTFIHALAGSHDSPNTEPMTVTVDGLMKTNAIDRLEILHVDTQGAEHKVLIGARQAIEGGKIRFVFISSHGTRMHARCLGFLRKFGYHIIVEHTSHESFSHDGLIVATANPGLKNEITISCRSPGIGKQMRSLLCRLQSYFVH